MGFPEEEKIENGILPVRMSEDGKTYVVNVNKLLSMIDVLEKRIESLEIQAHLF